MTVIAFVYVLFFWAYAGRTPGMMAVGLRIQNERGRAPSLNQALSRLLWTILPVPGLGLLWMLWSPEQRALNDKMARTAVVRD